MKTVLAAAATLAILAAPSVQAQVTPKKGGTVVVAIGSDPTGLNPVVSTATADMYLGCVLYQGLTRVVGGDVLPMLAKSWTISPDGLSYSFDLVQANWQDGKPFTSADVKYSLIEANAKLNSLYVAPGKMIDGIDTPAPDKVVIRLKQPFGPFLLSQACDMGGAILPKHVFEGTNIQQNPATTVSPIGLGAFTLKEWKRNDQLRFAANPSYWEKGKPYLDELAVKIIPQSSTRSQAVQAGEVDNLYYVYLATSDIPVVQANAKLKVFPTKASPTNDTLSFNVRNKPIDDKKVRQALLVATDRDYLLKNAWLGYGKVGTIPFSTEITWATSDIDFRKLYAFDPARANVLLDEAGVKRGADSTRFKLKAVIAAEEPEHIQVAAALKSMWKAVGVDLEVITAERATQLKRVFQDFDFDVTLNGYGTYYDPGIGLARLYLTSSIGTTYGNPSGYKNAAIDDLFAQGERATGFEARGAIYKKIQAVVGDEIPVFPLREKAFLSVASKKVQGLDNKGAEKFGVWRDVWLAE